MAARSYPLRSKASINMSKKSPETVTDVDHVFDETLSDNTGNEKCDHDDVPDQYNGPDMVKRMESIR